MGWNSCNCRRPYGGEGFIALQSTREACDAGLSRSERTVAGADGHAFQSSAPFVLDLYSSLPEPFDDF